MIEFSEQNNLNLWLKFKFRFKNNLTYRVIFMMMFFWLLVNIVLFSLININRENQWQIISGFNLGALGSLFAFLILSLSSKQLFSKVSIKRVLAYFTFLFRVLIYGAIIGLAIYFKFFNLISIVAGFSLLIVAVLSSEFLLLSRTKKEKKKC